MNTKPIKILLADDDYDDCLLFKEALEELSISTALQTVNNGIDLINHLLKHDNSLPDLVFVDLNMPLKNGTECLTEIKSNKLLKHITIIIVSTSMDVDVIESLYDKKADYFFSKPSNFNNLKNLIQESIIRTLQNSKQPEKNQFVIA